MRNLYKLFIESLEIILFLISFIFFDVAMYGFGEVFILISISIQIFLIAILTTLTKINKRR